MSVPDATQLRNLWYWQNQGQGFCVVESLKAVVVWREWCQTGDFCAVTANRKASRLTQVLIHKTPVISSLGNIEAGPQLPTWGSLNKHLDYSDSLCQVFLDSWAWRCIPTLSGAVLLKSPSAEEKVLPLCFGWWCSCCSWHLTLVLPWKVYIMFSTQFLVLYPWLLSCMHLSEQAGGETLVCRVNQ